MEVSLEGYLVRAGRTSRAESVKMASGNAEAAAARTDSLTLTRQAVEQMAEQSQRLQDLLAPKKTEDAFPLLRCLDGEKSENDALSEGIKTMERCRKIAARIMRGDKVPPKDAQYLMENDPEGYKLAMALRKPKKKPKEWESVLKDEKKADQSENRDASAPAESCGASEGTSEESPEGGTSDGSTE